MQRQVVEDNAPTKLHDRDLPVFNELPEPARGDAELVGDIVEGAIFTTSPILYQMAYVQNIRLALDS